MVTQVHSVALCTTPRQRYLLQVACDVSALCDEHAAASPAATAREAGRAELSACLLDTLADGPYLLVPVGLDADRVAVEILRHVINRPGQNALAQRMRPHYEALLLAFEQDAADPDPDGWINVARHDASFRPRGPLDLLKAHVWLEKPERSFFDLPRVRMLTDNGHG